MADESKSLEDQKKVSSSDEVVSELRGHPFFRVLMLLFVVALLYTMQESLSPFLIGTIIVMLVLLARRDALFEVGAGSAVGVLLLVWLLDELAGILWPFVTSFVLAYLLAPLVKVMEKRISRSLAIGSVVVLLLGILTTIGVVLIPLVIQEVGDLVTQLPRYGDALRKHYENLVVFIQAQGYEISTGEIQDKVLGQLPEIGKLFATQATSLLNGLTSGLAALLNLMLIPFVTYYILKNFELIKKNLLSLLPRKHVESTGDLVSRIDNVLGHYVRGQFLVCGFVAALTALGLALFDIRYSVLLGLFTGLANLVPFVGIAVSLGLASLVVLLDVDPLINLIKVIGVFVVVQNIEGNFLSPRVVGNKVGLDPAWVMFALVISAHFWGIVGMIVAIPGAAILNILVKILKQRYIRSRYYDLSN
ncbi:MAG: putative PurR-regulated permease PerM [Candidatus Latescibacterota bacterium]|jgi:predicted PurR-regulated permease PerM